MTVVVGHGVLAGPVATRDTEAPAGASISAVDQLRASPAPVPRSPGLYDVWNAQLQSIPVPPLERSLVEEESPQPTAGGDELMPWLYLVAGIALGSLLVWLGMRRGRSLQEELSRASYASVQPSGSREIELISSQVFAGEGALLVVSVCGERLVLGVSGDRSSVTLLTRLGTDERPPSMAPGTLGMLMGASPPSAARATSVPVPSYGSGRDTGHSPGEGLASEQGSTAHVPDEDLEQLLDELLGKVRGLKPLSKRIDDT